MNAPKLVGVVGGTIGHDPFAERTWSGSSRFVFRELANQGVLHRAFGAELPPLQRWLVAASNFNRVREVWRRHLYMDPLYRDALTDELGRHVEPGDRDHGFLQVGALFNMPRLLGHGTRCFSYHDGNLAQALRSPMVPKGLSARRIDAALAYERAVYHGMDRVLSMSEYLRQSFITDFGLSEDRVVTVGAGINLESIPAHVPDKRYDGCEALFIGVEFARKGGWELLRAFRVVTEHLPHARLHIVGPRTLSIPTELRRGVVFQGFLNKHEPEGKRVLADLFARCCLFVMPSLYEPFGIAPLESMAHQIPCLVTDGWALREMVLAGETGELVSCGSVEDLQSKLLECLRDPDRLRRMGEAARARVLGHYTWDKVVMRIKAATA